MVDDLPFRFSIQGLPEGEALEALTFEELEKLLEKLLKERGGKCKDTLLNLACLYSMTNRQEDSLRIVRQLLDVEDDPGERAFYFLILGQLSEQMSDYTAAAKYYKTAFTMEPIQNQTWYFINNNLGYCLNQMGHYDEAERYLEAALKIDPGRPNAHKNLGLSHQGRGTYVGAAQCFVAATQADASDGRSLAHLEQLVHDHPELLVDGPDLAEKLELCRKVVQTAQSQQPDFNSFWKQLRQERKVPWWKFWKRNRLDKMGGKD